MSDTSEPAEWRFLATNLGLEMFSAACDQASSPRRPHYALLGMLLAIAALLISIGELIYRGKKERVELRRWGMLMWFYHPPIPPYTPFGTLPDIYGLVAGISQCICSVIQYVYCLRNADNPLKASLLPAIFLMCLGGSRLCNKRMNANTPDKMSTRLLDTGQTSHVHKDSKGNSSSTDKTLLPPSPKCNAHEDDPKVGEQMLQKKLKSKPKSESKKSESKLMLQSMPQPKPPELESKSQPPPPMSKPKSESKSKPMLQQKSESESKSMLQPMPQLKPPESKSESKKSESKSMLQPEPESESKSKSKSKPQPPPPMSKPKSELKPKSKSKKSESKPMLQPMPPPEQESKSESKPMPQLKPPEPESKSESKSKSKSESESKSKWKSESKSKWKPMLQLLQPPPTEPESESKSKPKKD